MLAAPVQVAHSAWQGSHVFVEVFSNTFVAPQVVGQAVPSKNLPVAQLEHSLFKLPVHSPHSVWQGSQVFVVVFSNFPVGQVARHVAPSK